MINEQAQFSLHLPLIENSRQFSKCHIFSDTILPKSNSSPISSGCIYHVFYKSNMMHAGRQFQFSLHATSVSNCNCSRHWQFEKKASMRCNNKMKFIASLLSFDLHTRMFLVGRFCCISQIDSVAATLSIWLKQGLSQDLETGCPKLATVKKLDVLFSGETRIYLDYYHKHAFIILNKA